MVFKLPVWTVAAAVAGMVSPVQADIAFSTRLSGFGYSLIDLAPDDGIAPALTFQFQGYGVDAYVREGPWRNHEPPPAATEVRKVGLYDRDAPIFKGASLPHSSVFFGLSGAFADHGFTALGKGSLQIDRSDPDFGGEYSLSGTSALLSMSLTPMTQMVWSGTLAVFGENTIGRRGVRTETNEISASVALHNTANSEFYDYVSKGFVLRGNGPMRQRDVSDFSLVYSNLGSRPVDVDLTASMRGVGQGMLPVPEPGAHWLLLCGLGVLAGWRRFNGRRPD